ncbi:MAG: single-stranded DNA-binding protein [Nocardioidaceae bacterium]
MSGRDEAATEAVNEVRLVGRVSAPAEEKGLPSGDSVWTFRVVVDRPVDRARPRSSVDTVDCAVWSGRPRRSVRALKAGDVIEVRGAIRRRFFQTASGAASRVEVEVGGVQVIRRAASA